MQIKRTKFLIRHASLVGGWVHAQVTAALVFLTPDADVQLVTEMQTLLGTG